MYRLNLLGAFRIERNSHPIRFPTRKVEALLAFLAVCPEAHSREKLAALLWGDSTDDQARHSLRTALATIRKELGDGILLADRETVQLNPDTSIWVDVREFEKIGDSSISHPQSLISLYQGDLLTDFYDDWIVPERERLRELYLGLLLAVVQRFRSESQYERAVEYACKILATDPANEKAHQHLIFCYAAMGDRSAALKQYDECARLLHDELGVEPSSETAALRERIQAELTGAKSREALMTNLPHPLTSFVGRAREIVEINQLLAHARLITLIGAGGCGKTRLAIRVASDLAAENRFANGVWWVDLAALTDAALVTPAVAATFHLRQESPATPLGTILTDHLRDKATLLLLDNCEHLFDACARLVHTLLTACPRLQILATSRAALGIAGEVAWRVPSLTLPDAAQAPPHEIARFDAVRLFAERAALAAPHWKLPEHAPTVARICARLDGMPLAIELAAARLKVLSAEQIAARLDDCFALLTGGSATALPRHQTLRAAMDWSYDLLTEEERVLFHRLSIFAGGFSLEVVEHVCGKDILNLLTALVDKSLVLVEQQNAQARYRMLETIRQYARAKLLESGETARVHSQHLAFFLQFAERAESELRGAESRDWLQQVEAEHDNLRAALEWSLGLEAPSADAESGLRLAIALDGFWQRRNYWQEGREWIERALRVTEGIGAPRWRVPALKHAYRFANAMGDMNAARAHLQARETLVFALNDELGIAELLLNRAGLARLEHNLDTAQSLADEAHSHFRRLGNQSGVAAALTVLGLIKRSRGDAVGARADFDASLRLRQEIGEKETLGESLGMSAAAAFRAGDFASAHARFDELFALAQEQDDKALMRHALVNLGEVTRAAGNYREARPHYEASLTLARALPAKLHIGCAMQGLGYVAVQEGNLPRARECFEECFTLYQEQQLKWGVAVAVEGFARLAAAQGKPERAARWLGAIDAHLALTGPMATLADRLEHERTLAAVRALLDDAAFDAAWKAGTALTLEQAVAEVREL
jgi:non-specific serine/threonine protein kinase